MKMTLNEAIYLVLEAAEEYKKEAKEGSIVKGSKLMQAIDHLREFLGDYYIIERYLK